MASIREFVREEWLVLVAMVGACIGVVGMMWLLSSIAGMSLAMFFASPLTVLVVVLMMGIECCVVWWASRP